MEDGMYCSELVWKSESERCRSYLSDDFERTEVLLTSWRLCGAEMSGLDENFISNLEVRCRSSSGISGTLIVFLCFGYLGSEFLV
jgi:hypothetical protein